ncbi:MAG: sigma-70 family RNA polymerase sigma factor [Actinomycetota bacterium]|nr:sigma-70 family RNA polymerase sigma factor [Actinomycetota bacterium]
MNTATSDYGVIEQSEALLRLADNSPAPEKRAIHDQVIEMNLGLARSLAARYVGKGPDFDDLLQVASMGLVKAVQRYDVNKGHFASYAVPTILGELKRYFRDRAWMVRPPRRLQELQSVISSASAELSQSFQGSVDAKILAEHIGADPGDIREAMAASGCFAPTSLDADSTTAGRLWAARAVSIEEPGYELAERLATVAEHCRNLSEDDRRLLALRFFEDKTQQEIAEEVGMSQMQVSRHLKRILSFLHDSVMADAA